MTIDLLSYFWGNFLNNLASIDFGKLFDLMLFWKNNGVLIFSVTCIMLLQKLKLVSLNNPLQRNCKIPGYLDSGCLFAVKTVDESEGQWILAGGMMERSIGKLLLCVPKKWKRKRKKIHLDKSQLEVGVVHKMCIPKWCRNFPWDANSSKQSSLICYPNTVTKDFWYMLCFRKTVTLHR